VTYLVDANILSEPSEPAPTGLRWAELLARLRTSGKAMPVKDSLIAATALNLLLATHNRADFQKSGVRVIDPFASS